MVVGTELVMDNYIRHDALKDLAVHTHSELEEIRGSIEKMFCKYIGTMSDKQIKNQILQVVNYEYNYLGFEGEDLASLMSNFSMILSEYTDDAEFLNSLKRSIKCTVDGNIKGCLQDLKSDDNRSFVIVSMLLSNHAFNGIIYKKDDESYKLVVVNKGYRPRESKYEVYNIPNDNIDYIINNCLGFSKLAKISTEDLYEIMEDKGTFVEDEKVNASVSDVKYSELKARDQKNGNCFYKNAEAAFLLAWYTSFNKDEKAVTPKGPVSTKDLHIKFMKNIKEKRKYKSQKKLLDCIDREVDVYRRNKEFREYCKMNPEATSVQKRNECVKIFLDETKLDRLGEAEVEAKIDPALKMVDLETLKNNREIFLVSDHVELVNVVCSITDKLKYLDFLDKEEVLALESKFKQNKECLYKNFPNIADQLSKSIAIAIQSKVGGREVSKEVLDSVMGLNKDDIMFYLCSGDFDKYSRDKEEKLKKFCGVIPNHMPAQLEYMCVLMSGNKLEEALSECEDMISKNEDAFVLIDSLEEIIMWINKNGNLDCIIEKYNKNIEIGKQETVAYYGLGVAYWLLGDKDKSRENFYKACELNFKYNEYYLNFLQERGENDEVIARSDELLKERENGSISMLKATSIVKNAVSDKVIDNNVGDLSYAKKVLTDEINSRYKNELEYFWRGMCNMKLGLLEESRDDFSKVNDLDDNIVKTAIAVTYDLGYKSVGLKRCGDYLMEHEDDEVIMVLEGDIINDLEISIRKGKISKEDAKQIFKDAVSVDNVDHFSKVKGIICGKKDLCAKILDEVVVERMCERENIPLPSSKRGFYRYVQSASECIESLWQMLVEIVRGY